MEAVGDRLLFVLSIVFVSFIHTASSKCDVPLNVSDCGLRPTTVYTFDATFSFCIPSTWRGCPTDNKFDNDQQCLKSCVYYADRVTKALNSEITGQSSKIKELSSDCEEPLNISDCGLRPITVYTYFAPLSFCHPARWRGCPTYNKYDNEQQCLTSCIYDDGVTKTVNKSERGPPKKIKELSSNCDVPLNISDCGQRPTTVYTFFAPLSFCHRVKWRGCPTNNKYDNEQQCLKSCVKNDQGVTKSMKKTERAAPSKVKSKICDIPLNATRCTNRLKQVYTYNSEKKKCVKALSFGCPTENMFTDILACQQKCQVEWEETWDKEMDRMEKSLAGEPNNSPVVDIQYEIPTTGVMRKGIEFGNGIDDKKAYFIHKLKELNKDLDEREGVEETHINSILLNGYE